MWWNMLVARFFKNIYHLLISIVIVVTNFANWMLCNKQLRWKRKYAYPSVWMILSAVMLNSYFVNIIASPHLHQVLTPSARNSISSDPNMWVFLPPPKPPDKLKHTCKIKVFYDDNTVKEADNFTYNVCNANVTYVLSQTQQKKCGALIDRGTNGRIAGSDTCIINMHPTRKVDVQGIDNHYLPDIPIVTAGGVVNTQKGEVILVMNQYASVRKGKTIHSSGQLESFGTTVDDKSVKVGGYQRIITPDGYIILLQVRNGLVYMDMRPFTDKEKEELPMIVITSDLD